MDEQWTLNELVTEAAARLAALPTPTNGQIRAVPDDRTVRYYGTIGLLDRPLGARGRTALYGRRHLAQIVAIKRLQSTGRSLAEIQTLWATLDDHALTRMSGVELARTPARASRKDFWKRDAAASIPPASVPQIAPAAVAPLPTEIRLELTPHLSLLIALPEAGIAIAPADLRAIHAAAAPLIAELARLMPTPNDQENTSP